MFDLNKLNFKRTLLLIFFIGLVVRLIIAIYAYSHNVMQDFSDDKLYSDIAESIIEKGIMQYQDGAPYAYQVIGPGIPLILAFFKSISSSWLFIFFINSFLTLVIVFLIYKFAYIIINKPVALLAALWAVFYVPYLRMVPTSGKDMWISLLFLLLNYLYFKKMFKTQVNYWSILIFSFIFALLLHIDERYLAYIPFYFILILFNSFYYRRYKKGIKNAMVFSMALLLLLAPWTYRNYKALDQLFILTPRTIPVVSKITGKQQNIPKSPVTLKSATERYKISKEKIDSILAGHKGIKDNAGRLVKEQQYDAIQNHQIMPYAFSSFQNFLMCIRTMWKPIDITYNYTTGGYRFDGKWSLKHNLATGLSYGLLLPLALIGAWNLFRRKKEYLFILLSILLYHTLIHALFIPFTRFRYRIPVDFVLIILGAYGIWIIFENINKKFKIA